MDNKYNKYIIKLQGQEFITFKGLLAMAHDQGLESITTEMIMLDKDTVEEQKEEKTYVIQAMGLCIFRATVKGDNGTYSAYGDASPRNVGRMIKPHLIRMAETRSIARSLRLYTGCGYTAIEELGERS
jgi:hypothetical protein